MGGTNALLPASEVVGYRFGVLVSNGTLDTTLAHWRHTPPRATPYIRIRRAVDDAGVTTLGAGTSADATTCTTPESASARYTPDPAKAS
jgi:hypothetical protein